MTKQDLISAIAEKAGLSKKDAWNALNSFIEIITKSLKKGEQVTITWFWTFKISARKARTWVNPRKPSEKIKIPAMNLPAFKAWKWLKDAVR